MSSPGSVAISSSDEKPGERCPKLVRHRCRESRPQLLVGGHVADLAEIDDSLAATTDLVRDDQRHDTAVAGQQALGHATPLVDPLDRLTSAPAREHDHVGIVEDDHRLTALLDDGPTAERVRIHLRPF